MVEVDLDWVIIVGLGLLVYWDDFYLKFVALTRDLDDRVGFISRD